MGEDQPESAPPTTRIDAKTLRHKVLCGYQGWFRCPGDGTGEGWLHWSRDPKKLTPDSVTVEMWPDTTEYGEGERYPAPGFSGPGDQPAHLFSSANRRTVERHFEWMRQYGIDGVFVQRFLVNLGKPSFDAALAHRLIDFLKGDDRYSVTLVGGCQWQWRTVKDEQWARAFRRLDVLSPWNVGNYAVAHGKKVAATHSWQADIAEAKQHGREYLPVVYPGFGWKNLKRQDGDRESVPRRGGEFLWEQFVRASELGTDMAYVAMFDEVDEATAVFKVSNTPPKQARFQTYEGLPSDWCLRLTGEGTRLIRGERKAETTLPIRRSEKAGQP